MKHSRPLPEHRRTDDGELDAIAEFQRTDARFFSSPALRRFAALAHHLSCPLESRRPSARRTFLVDAPFNPPSKNGICALCHSGPMLNMVNQAHSDFAGGSPPAGARFFNTGVTIVNAQQSDPNVDHQRRDQPDGDGPVA